MPRFLLQARHQNAPTLIMDYCNYSTLYRLLCPTAEGRNTCTVAKKKKEKKEMGTHSFARIFFLLRSVTALLVLPVHSQPTVQYFIRGRKILIAGKKKTRSRRASVVHAVRVYCADPKQRPLVPRCAHQLKVDRTLYSETVL